MRTRKSQYTTAALRGKICSVDCTKNLDRAFIHHMQIAHLSAAPQDVTDCVHMSLPTQGVGLSSVHITRSYPSFIVLLIIVIHIIV